MPGGKERELRRRISSVQSTKKITRAMELIAATRVVKAMQRADAARPYARRITSVIENLAAGGASVDHPLLREVEEVKTVGFIVVLGGVVATLWLSIEVKTHVTPSPTFAPTEGFLFGR